MRKTERNVIKEDGKDILAEDCDRVLDMVDLSGLREKKVLITGVGGFIGGFIFSVLCRANRKLNLKCKITGVNLRSPDPRLKKYFNGQDVKFIKADLSKQFYIPGKYDFIFHAAGYGQPAKFMSDPVSTIKININATQILLDLAAKSGGTFMFFSSAEVYGEIPNISGGIKEDFSGAISTLNPRAVYGQSKRLGEALCYAHAGARGTKIKIARISHLYGPGISIYDTRMLGDFLRKALIKKKIELMDEGAAIKTWGYIGDAVAMLFHIMLHGKSVLYHVGGRDVESVRSLAERIGKLTKTRVILPRGKSGVKHAGADPRFVGLNTTKARSEMKKFSFMSLDEGLARTISWNLSEFSNKLK